MSKNSLEKKRDELTELNNNLASLEVVNKERGARLDLMQEDLNKLVLLKEGNNDYETKISEIENYIKNRVVFTGTDGGFEVIDTSNVKNEGAGLTGDARRRFSDNHYEVIIDNDEHKKSLFKDIKYGGDIYSWHIVDNYINKGKKYLIVGISNIVEHGGLDPERNGSMFASIEDTGELPSNIKIFLEKTLIDKYKEVQLKRPGIFAKLPNDFLDKFNIRYNAALLEFNKNKENTKNNKDKTKEFNEKNINISITSNGHSQAEGNIKEVGDYRNKISNLDDHKVFYDKGNSIIVIPVSGRGKDNYTIQIDGIINEDILNTLALLIKKSNITIVSDLKKIILENINDYKMESQKKGNEQFANNQDQEKQENINKAIDNLMKSISETNKLENKLNKLIELRNKLIKENETEEKIKKEIINSEENETLIEFKGLKMEDLNWSYPGYEEQTGEYFLNINGNEIKVTMQEVLYGEKENGKIRNFLGMKQKMSKLYNPYYDVYVSGAELKDKYPDTYHCKDKDEALSKVNEIVKTGLEITLKEIKEDKKEKPFEYFIYQKVVNPLLKDIFRQKSLNIIDLRKCQKNDNEYYGFGGLQKITENEGFFNFNIFGFVMVLKNVNELKGEDGIDSYSNKAIYKIVGSSGEIISDDIQGYDKASEIYREETEKYKNKVVEEFNNLNK